MRGIAFFLVSVYRHQATHSLACSHICLPKTCFFQSLSCLKLQGCLLLLRRVQTPGIRRSPCLSPTFCLFPYLSLHPTQYPLPSGQRPPCPRSSPSESQWGDSIQSLYSAVLLSELAFCPFLFTCPIYLPKLSSSPSFSSSPLSPFWIRSGT